MESHIWTVEKMRKYIGFVREAFEPELTSEAEQIFCRYFNFI
jgi:DNA replicative helicase MCM subunit Mcm2 (Cdc46/Mcm family)